MTNYIEWIHFLNENCSNETWNVLCEIITEEYIDLIPENNINKYKIFHNEKISTETKMRVLKNEYNDYVNNTYTYSFALNSYKYNLCNYGIELINELKSNNIIDMKHDLTFDDVKYYRKKYPNWYKLESYSLVNYYFTNN